MQNPKVKIDAVVEFGHNAPNVKTFNGWRLCTGSSEERVLLTIEQDELPEMELHLSPEQVVGLITNLARALSWGGMENR